jgi:ribosomal-protein-alanine N-acetyltransferase
MALRKSFLDSGDDERGLRRDWRGGLPELRDEAVTLRELCTDDAPSLVGHLHRPAVLQYIAPCPSTTPGFVRFILWAQAQRNSGGFACFGIVPAGETHAVGVIQFWPIERDYSTAEWGFALSESYWGSGLFVRSARLALDAAFAQLGIHRLEARVVDVNAFGNRVLESLGATREGVLRDGFRNGDVVYDHVMWSILATDWRKSRGQAT